MKLSLDLKKNKIRNPLLITALIALVVGVWYQYFYITANETLKILQQKQNDKQKTLRTILALKPQLSTLKEHHLQSQIKLDSLKFIFPDQKEIPRLIREINAVAKASSIIITRFNPMDDIEKEYYVENRYSMALEGGYHELGDFIAFLANFPLIINLTSVNIVASQINVQNESEVRLYDEGITVLASFEMTTFSSKK